MSTTQLSTTKKRNINELTNITSPNAKKMRLSCISDHQEYKTLFETLRNINTTIQHMPLIILKNIAQYGAGSIIRCSNFAECKTDEILILEKENNIHYYKTKKNIYCKSCMKILVKCNEQNCNQKELKIFLVSCRCNFHQNVCEEHLDGKCYDYFCDKYVCNDARNNSYHWPTCQPKCTNNYMLGCDNIAFEGFCYSCVPNSHKCNKCGLLACEECHDKFNCFCYEKDFGDRFWCYHDLGERDCGGWYRCQYCKEFVCSIDCADEKGMSFCRSCERNGHAINAVCGNCVEKVTDNEWRKCSDDCEQYVCAKHLKCRYCD